MDSWPADGRASTHAETEGNESHSYPLLDYGTSGPITLSETGGRWRWSSVFTNKPTNRLRTSGEFIEIFPASRPPPVELPHTTITQRSEHAAAFLRTHLPDIDIPSALIRDELTADAQIMQKFEEFDPQVGARMAIVFDRGLHVPPTSCAFLAFPMGELNRELNMSPITFSDQGNAIFRPTSRDIHTFETPILQIVSSNTASNLINAEPREQHLAIRTFSSTTIFEAMSKNTSPLTVRLIEKTKIFASDVGNRPVADVKLCRTPGTGVVVNSLGDVYSCNIHNESAKPKLVHSQGASSSGDAGDGFWRLALSASDHQCLLASSMHLKSLDFRTNASGLDLLSLQNGVLTAIEDVGDDHVIRLVSTSEILWVDERSPRKPLLGYKHGRQFDRSLNIQTVNLATPLTFLTSRRNGLVTVYDVSRSDDGLLHVNAAPYALDVGPGHFGTNICQTILQYPPGPQNNNLSLLRMCERGSIQSMSLHVSANDDDDDSAPLSVKWSKDIHQLHKRAAHLRPNIGPLGERDVRRVDFRATYEQLFMSERDDMEWGKERDPEVVYDNIEKMPLFWQESDGQAESMLTTFDVAFRSGEEPTRSSRADFLTQCAINSTRGYRAMLQGRLSTDKLAKDAPWSCDIFPILEQNIDLPESPRISAESFRQYDLRYDNPLPQFLRRESQAREQLALDLALSTRVFSPRPFAVSPCLDTADKLESMSRAAEALSINDEPPRVQFGYLQPIPKQDDGDPSQTLAETLSQPLGVRLLLKEWEIGADPLQYKYEDPYSESFGNTRSAKAAPTPAANPRLAPSVPPRKDTMPFVSLSQGAPSVNARVENETGPSSQILSGPHGGRVPASKKKTAKKRLGGF